jgi:integrase/recombinase XerD
MTTELARIEPQAADLIVPDDDALAPPQLIIQAGANARFAWEEVFGCKVRNPHTRRAYLAATRRFLAWCQLRQLELTRIVPSHIGAYFDELKDSLGPDGLKLHRAALRGLFDELVIRHAIVLNPASSLRLEKHRRDPDGGGRTPDIGVEQARALLGSIATNNVVGLRDRAIIAILIYTAARVGAVARLRRGDLFHDGTQSYLLFREKNGVVREIPVRHDLEGFLHLYLAAAQLDQAPKAVPLFRSVTGRATTLSDRPFNAIRMNEMIKRRLKDAGIGDRFSPHSFRVTTITALLEQNVPIEDVQFLAGHADIRTTRLYDRRRRKVTRNIVERIPI